MSGLPDEIIKVLEEVSELDWAIIECRSLDTFEPVRRVRRMAQGLLAKYREEDKGPYCSARDKFINGIPDPEEMVDHVVDANKMVEPLERVFCHRCGEDILSGYFCSPDCEKLGCQFIPCKKHTHPPQEQNHIPDAEKMVVELRDIVEEIAARSYDRESRKMSRALQRMGEWLLCQARKEAQK